MPIQIDNREGRLFLRLRVTPKARQDRITGEHGGALKLQVKEPPEKGRANEGVIRLLSKTLEISAREIELVSGHASQDKRVAISGISESELLARLAAGSTGTGTR